MVEYFRVYSKKDCFGFQVSKGHDPNIVKSDQQHLNNNYKYHEYHEYHESVNGQKALDVLLPAD